MDLKNKDFSSVDKKYLPIPFWSLNDRLTQRGNGAPYRRDGLL